VSARLPSGAVSTAEVESARREWESGSARLLEGVDDARERERLLTQVGVVREELQRRLGGTFTLSELARAYAHAEQWSREVVGERAAGPGWTRTLSFVEAAAFHDYARGAVDYEP
jgi:hypothetical protein